MKLIDKLPHHKQMAVVYEITGRKRGDIANLLGVAPETISNWRSETEYQAALQEMAAEIREVTLDKYVGPIHVVIDGIVNEAVRQVQDGDDLRTLEMPKLVKSLTTLFDLAARKETLRNPQDPKPGEEKVDRLSGLKKRIAESHSGQEFIGEKKGSDEEGA